MMPLVATFSTQAFPTTLNLTTFSERHLVSLNWEKIRNNCIIYEDHGINLDKSQITLV